MVCTVDSLNVLVNTTMFSSMIVADDEEPALPNKDVQQKVAETDDLRVEKRDNASGSLPSGMYS